MREPVGIGAIAKNKEDIDMEQSQLFGGTLNMQFWQMADMVIGRWLVFGTSLGFFSVSESIRYVTYLGIPPISLLTRREPGYPSDGHQRLIKYARNGCF